MKNQLNKKLIGLMAVGISAGLMVCPVHARADEGIPEGGTGNDPEPELETGGEDFSNDAASVPDIGDEAAQLIEDAENDAIDADGGFVTATVLAEEAAGELNDFNQNPTTVSEGEAVVSDATALIQDAQNEYAVAEQKLEDAQDALDEAGALLIEADENQSTIERQLEVANADKEQLEAEVKTNEEAAEEAKTEADSYDGLDESGFQKILEGQNELEDMKVFGSSDAEYAAKQDEVSTDIMQYYILNAEGEGLTNVSFEKKKEDCIIDYMSFDDGILFPITTELSYWTVNYTTPDGQVHQRKYQYEVDEDGDFNFTSVEEVKQVYKQGQYEDKDGMPFEATDTTYSVEVERADGTAMIYAIDTATDQPDSVVNARAPQYKTERGKGSNTREQIIYEKSSEPGKTDVEYKFSDDGESVTQISVIDYDKYNVKTTKVENGTPIVKTYSSYSEAVKDGERRVAEMNADPNKPKNVTYTNWTRLNGSGGSYANYATKTTITTEIKDVVAKTTTYTPNEYRLNTTTELVEKTIVKTNVETLGSTKDAKFQQAMEEHKDEIADAAAAERAYETAKENLDNSVKKLNAVNSKIEELKGRLVTDEELDKLNNDHAIALARVELAQEAKNDAAAAIKKAETALKDSEAKIDDLRARRTEQRNVVDRVVDDIKKTIKDIKEKPTEESDKVKNTLDTIEKELDKLKETPVTERDRIIDKIKDDVTKIKNTPVEERGDVVEDVIDRIDKELDTLKRTPNENNGNNRNNGNVVNNVINDVQKRLDEIKKAAVEDNNDIEKSGRFGDDDYDIEKSGKFGNTSAKPTTTATNGDKNSASNLILKDNTSIITGASDVIRNDAALNSASDSAAEKVYKLVTKYNKTAINSLKDKAEELVPSLTPTSKVRLFVMLSRDYYLKNLNNPGFKFFDAERYLEKNPDVKSAAIASGEQDLKVYALNHYLDRGIYEGRSSMSAFDPVKAIITNPGLFDEVSVTDTALPEAVYNAYSK